MATQKESHQESVQGRLEEAGNDHDVIRKIIDSVIESPVDIERSVEDEALLLVILSALESGGKLQAAGIQDAVAQIHKKLARQTDAILHDPGVQRVEAAWRGLRHLVDNTDFRKGCKIAVLDVSKDDLVNDFEDELDITKSALYRLVYSEGLGAFRGQPVGAVIANYEFGPGHRDVELLRKCAAVASMAHAPFISAASAQMIGVESFTEIPRLKDLGDIFRGKQFNEWRGFREEADARYVGLTLPRYIARPVWTSDMVKSFTYAEDVSRSHEHILWGNMAFLFATRLVAAHADYGWCGNIIGPKGGGAVKAMNTYSFKEEGTGTEAIKIPTEVKLTLRREYELAEAGFIPLIWAEGSAEAVFFSAASAKAAKKFRATPAGDEAAANDFLGTQLPYMFIVSRIAHYIKRIQVEHIGSSTSKKILEDDLNDWIGQYVNPIAGNRVEMARKPLKGAKITVTEIASKPGWYEFDVEVTPHFKYQGSYFTLSLVGKMDASAKTR
jgi:type VI secretion system protein ImpC